MAVLAFFNNSGVELNSVRLELFVNASLVVMMLPNVSPMSRLGRYCVLFLLPKKKLSFQMHLNVVLQ